MTERATDNGAGAGGGGGEKPRVTLAQRIAQRVERRMKETGAPPDEFALACCIAAVMGGSMLYSAIASKDILITGVVMAVTAGALYCLFAVRHLAGFRLLAGHMILWPSLFAVFILPDAVLWCWFPLPYSAVLYISVFAGMKLCLPNALSWRVWSRSFRAPLPRNSRFMFAVLLLVVVVAIVSWGYIYSEMPASEHEFTFDRFRAAACASVAGELDGV